MSGTRQKSVILVLGMHRSGTSALTRVLNLLGAGLCGDLLPQGQDNAMGFWESASVLEANQKILECLGSVWFDFSPLPPDAADRPSVDKALRNLAKVLERELPTGQPAVLKDPRFCRLLPLVLPLFAEQGRMVKVVIIHRHPWEVALSLKKRNGFDQDLSLLLWMRHLLDAEQYSRALPRAMCGFEELLRDWPGVAKRLGHDLGIDWPVEPGEAKEAVEEFLTPGMRHHDAGNRRTNLTTTPLGQATDKLHTILQQSGADLATVPTEAFDEARGMLDRAAAFCAPLILRQLGNLHSVFEWAESEKRELSAENQRLAEALSANKYQLEHITSSRIWRATRPLRLAAGRLKGRRR
ncbi:MAG: sulfotransferase [Deltaproteobacteria bacterium]|nr:sulfotransferase [Deltaproteobacteria bacterium]